MHHPDIAVSAPDTARVPVHAGYLLAMANERFATGVDSYMNGGRITDCDVLLNGAYGPAVMRLVNLAADQHTSPIPRARMLELAEQAFALVEDIDLKGNVITEYKVVLSEPHGFGPVTLGLVNLAIEHQVILRRRQ